jgi:hypothetical protein
MANTLQSIKLLAEPVRSLAAGSISSGYMGIGGPLNYPARIILVQNFTDATLMFSLDGIDDNFPLTTNAFLLLDVTGNRALNSGFFISDGTRFYVREIETPTMGAVYVSSFYGFNS